MQFYIICLFLVVLVSFVTTEKGSVVDKNEERIFNPYPNSIPIRSPKLKLTAATIKNKPSQTEAISKSHNKNLRKNSVILTLQDVVTAVPPKNPKGESQVLENIVESKPLIIRDSRNFTHQQIVNSQRVNVIETLLGLVGIRPPDKPPGIFPTPVTNCRPCTCGQAFKQKRIVGGIETVKNAYPWMTALLYNNRFLCGGSLINNKYVLTAAHCVNGFSKDKYSAVFLDHDRSTSLETKTETRKIKNIYSHGSYGHGGNYNNDIALLQLDQEVSFNGMLKPVCLPTIGKSFTGLNGIVTGWGATKEHGSIANRLQEVTVPILSNMDCHKTGYGSRITPNMMCAGFPTGKKDSCQGDSGGPLHIINGTSHHVVGIVSWGDGCARPNYPGVYTRVNRYITWIKNNTPDACYC